MDLVPIDDEAHTEDMRNNMVDGQLRPNRVSEPRLLAALRRVAREAYVDPEQRALAYADATVRMGGARLMPAPLTTARMIQALAVAPGARVLVLGAGYGAAVLAEMGVRVTVVDDAAPPHVRAALARCGATLHAGRMAAGHKAEAPYRAILVDGAVSALPPLWDQLEKSPAGRLCAIRSLGADRAMGMAVLAEAVAGGWSERVLFDCAAPLLADLCRPAGFRFGG